MSLNWKEIDEVLAELNLSGSHIQRIIQPDFASLVLSIYRPGDPFDLFISLESGKTRLHRLSDSLKSPTKLQRFSQFLRARCKGAKITDAYQVHGDRIVKLATAAAGLQTILWIRLWGGAANIIATDERGTILDAFYRRPGRGEVTGGSYDPEAPTDGKSPRTLKEYEIRNLPGSGSFNARVEAFYRAGVPRADLETLRLEALAAVERRESRLMGRLENLERQHRANENADRYRELGDLLMSNLHEIQEGEETARIESYYDDGEVIEIKLDPKLRPEQNAEGYYEKYKKAKSGSEKLTGEIAQLEEELSRLRHRRREILESADARALSKIVGAASKRRVAKSNEPATGLQFQSGLHRIIVGRSASENDALLRKHVRGNDLWLHARDYPGSYVFIKNVPGKSIPLEVMLDAGNLALFYSKARSGGQADLYYTQVKYLRRPKEGKKGLVLPTHEKNLLVRHDQKRLDRLFREREESEAGI